MPHICVHMNPFTRQPIATGYVCLVGGQEGHGLFYFILCVADRLKSLFGSSGKSDALVYDPSYATMDPVPHNVSSQSTFSVNVPVRSSAAGGSTPVGARE